MTLDEAFEQAAALQRAGSLAQAQELYKAILAAQPENARAHDEWAVLMMDAGRSDLAEPLLRKAIELAPGHALAHAHLGFLLLQSGRLQEAQVSLHLALERQPDLALAHNCMGIAAQRLGQCMLAETSFRAAVQAQPGDAEAHHNLGVALRRRGQLAPAQACFRTALELRPGWTAGHSNLLFAMACDGQAGGSEGQAQARRYGRQVSLLCPQPLTHPAPDPDVRTLRVGLVSGDLHNHPVGHFLLALLGRIDPSRVEFFVYPTSDHRDGLTVKLQALSARWQAITALNDRDAAHLIRSHQLHVLLDLSGHTAGNRLPLFAWKPAPVQGSWLGYFATTGVAQIDWLLTDPISSPAGDESQFTERLVRLPDSRLCLGLSEQAPPVAPLPALRRGHLTFGSFQSYAKLSDQTLQVWARVLTMLPVSRLRVQCDLMSDPDCQKELLARTQALGIASDRVSLHVVTDRQAYLSAHAEVDLILDSFPYPGGTTTCEALWMGVPTIVMPGHDLLSRQGASLMTAAGMADWVASDERDFIAKAAAWAGDLTGLARLRSGLRERVAGTALFDADRFARHFESAVQEMWRAHVQTQRLLALFQRGDWPALEQKAQEQTAKDPYDAFAFKALGLALQQQGKDAVPALVQAAELAPDDAEAWSNLGHVLASRGSSEQALASFQHALKVQPGSAQVHQSTGSLLRSLGRSAEALPFLREACELSPKDPVHRANLGGALHELGDYRGAVAAFESAIALKRDFAEAWSSLGNTRREMGELLAAVSACRQAVALKPDFAPAHGNLGNALQDMGQPDEARASLLRALSIEPGLFRIRSNLLFGQNYSLHADAAELLAQARLFGDLAARGAQPFAQWPGTTDAKRCLRIGLVSADLRQHPVGYFLEAFLKELADRAAGRMDLQVYSQSTRSDALTVRLRACCSSWREVAALSDEALARQIHADGIDILIDLAGHTAHNRLPVFAWKPAPVQVSWLGYFATTGVQAMDYLLADPWTLSPDLEAHFTESVWRLPRTRLCFSVPDVDVPVGPLPALASGQITFGCFNNLAKLNEEVLSLWARILAGVPASRLFLKSRQLNDPLMREQVATRFAALGIPAGRLRMEGFGTREQYLASYRQVDIALDPFPFPGGTTSVEALWMGVPVLTLAGDRFLSRQGVGLMMNAGLEQWVASDAQDYLARALRLSSDLPALAHLRDHLRAQVLASPLFDAGSFALEFEAALRAMWQRHCEQTLGIH